MDKSKAVSFFSETIKSDFTKKSYLHHLSQFLRFTKIKDYDTMLDLDSKKIQELCVLSISERPKWKLHWISGFETISIKPL